MKTVLIVVGIIVVAIAVSFGINLLLTKGIIWVLYELFKIDWRNKFWPVFTGVYILAWILGLIGKQSVKS